MKKLISIVIAALSMLGAGHVNAANYQGVVSSVYAFNGSVYVLITNGSFDGAASSCWSGTGMVYSIDPNTAFGRSLMAMALTAKTTGILVYAIGTSACTGGQPYGGSRSSEGLSGLDLKG